MFRTLIVPLDGSVFAEHVIPTAVDLAKRGSASLHLIRVHEGAEFELEPNDTLDAQMRTEAQDYVAGVAKHIETEHGVAATPVLLEGRAADSIIGHARRADEPLIVMSTHGRTGFSRLWLGSVTDAVVRRGRVPVLVLRPSSEQAVSTPTAHAFKRMLIPVDGTALGESALNPALSLATLTGASVQLLRVVQPMMIPMAYAAPIEPTSFTMLRPFDQDSIDALVEHAEGYVTNLTMRLRADYPAVQVDGAVRLNESLAQAVVNAASAFTCDVVALATHGRGASRLVLASVADKVVRAGPEAVLLVRPNTD
jgi:nucleotide-binding universal stress UspA family protein